MKALLKRENKSSIQVVSISWVVLKDVGTAFKFQTKIYY